MPAVWTPWSVKWQKRFFYGGIALFVVVIAGTIYLNKQSEGVNT